jgi:hypothetical protein
LTLTSAETAHAQAPNVLFKVRENTTYGNVDVPLSSSFSDTYTGTQIGENWTINLTGTVGNNLGFQLTSDGYASPSHDTGSITVDVYGKNQSNGTIDLASTGNVSFTDGGNSTVMWQWISHTESVCGCPVSNSGKFARPDTGTDP